MGHHDGAHGRVFRGMRVAKRPNDHNDNAHHLAHRQASQSHNTNGDRPVMHIPEGFAAQKAQVDDTSDNADDDSGVETVYEQVYKTVLPTFDGPPQFFSTASREPTTTRSVQSAAETTTAAANSRQGNDDNESQTPSRMPVAQSTATSSASASSSALPTPSTSSAAQQAAVSSEKSSATSSAVHMDITSSSIQTGDVTYTHGAKAADNTSSMIGGTPLSATHSAVAESQEDTGMTSGAKAGLAMGIIFGLALVFGLIFFCWRRKKSQRGLEEHNEKSGFATAAPVPVNRFSSDSDRLRRTSTQTSATAPRLSLRPVTQFLPNLTSGNAPNATQNPFGDAAVVSEKGHDRTESINSESNRSVESATTANTGTAQVATAAAVPVARGPNNVHRVQLEFKPSMEDELELKSGQLVRMLHEYDDGWALCTKMDRSQKGVVPRTCLSKMPVKPRGPPPQNGPPSAGPNGMATPPPVVDGAMAPRPLTPNQPTQQQSRPRAPTLEGVPARKPVPGQAL